DAHIYVDEYVVDSSSQAFKELVRRAGTDLLDDLVRNLPGINWREGPEFNSEWRPVRSVMIQETPYSDPKYPNYEENC
ncbi:MAG: hypothetical protein ACP5G8_04795, partial [Athalassotoga sp.]